MCINDTRKFDMDDGVERKQFWWLGENALTTETIPTNQFNTQINSTYCDASDEDALMQEESPVSSESTSLSSSEGHLYFWRSRRSLHTSETEHVSNTSLSSSSAENEVGGTDRIPFWCLRHEIPLTNETNNSVVNFAQQYNPLYPFSMLNVAPVSPWKPVIHSGKAVKSCLKVKRNEESVRNIYRLSVSRPSFQLNSVMSKKHREESKVRKVSFSELEIREYEVVLTDNPYLSSGPGVGLGWYYDEKLQKYQIDAYEEVHPPRRHGFELKIPGGVRETMLLETWDIPPKEIAKVKRGVNIRKLRLTFSQWNQMFNFTQKK